MKSGRFDWRAAQEGLAEGIVVRRRLSPCVDQTYDEIAAYYRAVEVGSPAIVRRTHGGLLRYDLSEVTGTKPRCGRVYVKNFGAFYAKSGRNCFHPKGQTSLVVPTEEVRDWLRKHPGGEMNVRTWRDNGEPVSVLIGLRPSGQHDPQDRER